MFTKPLLRSSPQNPSPGVQPLCLKGPRTLRAGQGQREDLSGDGGIQGPGKEGISGAEGTDGCKKKTKVTG